MGAVESDFRFSINLVDLEEGFLSRMNVIQGNVDMVGRLVNEHCVSV